MEQQTIDLSAFGTTAAAPVRPATTTTRCCYCGDPLPGWRAEYPGNLPACGVCQKAKGSLSLEGYRAKIAKQCGVSTEKVGFWFEETGGEDE